jgi:hypothetical protein
MNRTFTNREHNKNLGAERMSCSLDVRLREMLRSEAG